MDGVALKMLWGDRGKYLSLVLGLAFAVLLITQQGSIFLGMMLRSTGLLQNVGQPDFFVVDPHVRYVMELRALPDIDLFRVRSVEGVQWAEPLFVAWADVNLPDGSYRKAHMMGIDRSTMVGQPPEMTEGSLDDLRAPGAVVIEESGREKLGGVRIGDTLKLNDRRALIVGFFRAKLGFESNILIYTTFDNAKDFTPVGRNTMSLIMVKVKPNHTPAQVMGNVNQISGVMGVTREQFQWLTFRYIVFETGIGLNFAVTILLGFIVGLVVSSATFYQFTVENLRHFAVLKAIGAKNRVIVRMILLQALVVGLVGFGIGVGIAGLFTLTSRHPGAELSAFFPWQLMAASLVATIICVGLGSLLSLRRVLTLEPAVVFK